MDRQYKFVAKGVWGLNLNRIFSSLIPHPSSLPKSLIPSEIPRSCLDELLHESD